MKANIPENCGNSPRSLLAAEIAINLVSNNYDALEPLLADDFSWNVVGSGREVAKSELQNYMEKAAQSNAQIDRFDVLTSISHGKYAAVSSRAYSSNDIVFNSHDLYEFTSAGGSARLLSVTTYVVDNKPSQ